MASQPIPKPQRPEIDISASTREFLQLKETETHYAVRTLSGATLLRPKSEIRFSWELLEGILDDGKDTSEERRRERDWELAHDERKFGCTKSDNL